MLGQKELQPVEIDLDNPRKYGVKKSDVPDTKKSDKKQEKIVIKKDRVPIKEGPPQFKMFKLGDKRPEFKVKSKNPDTDYYKGVPRDALNKMKMLGRYDPINPEMQKPVTNKVEELQFERLASICSRKPFTVDLLQKFPMWIVQFFRPYAKLAKDNGIITDFGNAILKHTEQRDDLLEEVDL